MAVPGQNLQCDCVLRRKTKVYVKETRKTLHEQPCTDEQHEGERYFCRDKSASEPPLSGRRTGPLPVRYCPCLSADGSGSRRCPEPDGGYNDKQHDETDDACINRQISEPRHFRGTERRDQIERGRTR